MGKVLKICVATNNDHKMGELKDIFKDYAVELYSLKDLNIDVNPDENGKNYAENAFIKASAVAKFTDMPVLSDDSGIEIEALGEHVPGIYSHRYAVEHGGQEITNKMLIEKCAGSKAHFTAHFVLLNLTDMIQFLCRKDIKYQLLLYLQVKKIISHIDIELLLHC